MHVLPMHTDENIILYSMHSIYVFIVGRTSKGACSLAEFIHDIIYPMLPPLRGQ